MRACKGCFSIVIALLLANPASAAIYKWVDEQGRTHFSETKPKNAEASDISQKLEETGNIVEMEQADPAAFKSSLSTASEKVALTVSIKTYDYELTAKAMARMRSQVRAIYRAYVAWFGWPPKAQRPVVIKIFGQYQAFIDYQKQRNNGRSTHRSHYSTVRREVVMLGNEFSEDTLETLLHEASHAIIHMESRRTPKWINEGMAEVFGYSRISKGRVKLSSDPEWVEKLKHQLREGSLNPLGAYLDIPDNQWGKKSRRVERSYYTVAWGLMRYMMATQENRQILSAILETRKTSAWWQSPSLSQRFNEHYPGGLDELNKHWRSWIRTL